MAPAAPNGAIGMRYALPALQYNTTITRRLKKCEIQGQGRSRELVLAFDVAVEAKPEMVDGEWFAIDYRDLGSWSKTSSFEMDTYENQTLKSFNAKADDQSGEIAAGAIKAGFSIARLAFGVPAPPPGAASSEVALVCPDEDLKNYAALKASLEAKTESLNDLNAQLEPWIVQGLIGTLTDDDKKKISAIRTQVVALTKEIAGVKKKMDEVAAKLSWIETFEFQPQWDDGGAGLDRLSTFPSDEASRRKLQLDWARRLFGRAVDPSPDAPERDVLAKIGAQMDSVVMTVRRSDSADPASVCDQAGVKPGCEVPRTPKWNEFVSETADARPKAVPGIAYRTPARGRLRICSNASAETCVTGPSKEQLISDTSTVYPQLGRLGILPFTNGFGQNNELSATFRPDGSIEKAAYSEKRARGKVLVDVINGGLDQALALDKSIRDLRKAELAEAEGEAAAELDRQITLATKQKTLLELQKALDSDNIAAADELARVNAEIAQLTAEKNLRTIREQLEAAAGTQ